MNISEQLIKMNNELITFTQQAVNLNIDNRHKTMGQIDCSNGEMIINPEIAVKKALQEILLHEHTHYLLYKSGFDPSHSIEYFLLYNVLKYKFCYADNEKHIYNVSFNEYNMSDYKDLKYLNIKLLTYKRIVKRIARTENLESIILKCIEYAKYIKSDYKSKRYYKSKIIYLCDSMKKDNVEVEQIFKYYEESITKLQNKINKLKNNWWFFSFNK